jgi:hypothetical protein
VMMRSLLHSPHTVTQCSEFVYTIMQARAVEEYLHAARI